MTSARGTTPAAAAPRTCVGQRPMAPARWTGQALRLVCECEHCLAHPDQSTHSDRSHDQSLDQRFTLASSGAVDRSIRIVGGTTKCARVLVDWFDGDDAAAATVRQAAVVEVGSGTGLVGIALSRLGARSVVLTDQEPVLDVLQHNAALNPSSTSTISVGALYWGSAVPESLLGMDLIIGSDLIFAKENIPLLLRSFDDLCSSSSQRIVFAHIDRFRWEQSFFDGMIDLGFDQTVLHRCGDISIFQFTRAHQPS